MQVCRSQDLLFLLRVRGDCSTTGFRIIFVGAYSLSGGIALRVNAEVSANARPFHP